TGYHLPAYGLAQRLTRALAAGIVGTVQHTGLAVFRRIDTDQPDTQRTKGQRIAVSHSRPPLRFDRLLAIEAGCERNQHGQKDQGQRIVQQSASKTPSAGRATAAAGSRTSVEKQSLNHSVVALK